MSTFPLSLFLPSARLIPRTIDLYRPVYRNPRPVPPLKGPRDLLESVHEASGVSKSGLTSSWISVTVHSTESTEVQSGQLCVKGHTALSSEVIIKVSINSESTL